MGLDLSGSKPAFTDAAVVPFLRCQCRPPSAPCTRLQPRQLHADAGDAKDRGAVIANEPAGEADQHRREGHKPRPLRHLPNGRGRGAAADVPGNPVAGRPTSGTARAGMTGRWGQMRQTTTAELRLDHGKAASSSPASPSAPSFWLPPGRVRTNFVAAAPR